MEDTRVIVFKFLFLFLCVLLLFLPVVFQRAFYNFIGKICFHRSLLIQKYLSDGNFSNCLKFPTKLPTKRVFVEQVVRISLQNVSDFKAILKRVLFQEKFHLGHSLLLFPHLHFISLTTKNKLNLENHRMVELHKKRLTLNQLIKPQKKKKKKKMTHTFFIAVNHF